MNSAGAAVQRDPPHIELLGKYELLVRLGVGGMAELFVARATGQHGFEKLVVLKRILASHAGDQVFIDMLLDEARLAATLHHPNIVQVYDVGEVDGSYFFTMEYVFGEDLRSIVRAVRAQGKHLSLEQILQIIIGVAAGIHYAHEKEGSDGQPLGIVHRDISPHNILVSHDGSVKLIDFGIARVTAMNSKTAHGVVKGKVSYMSPEQCRGEPLDRRSDIFALGILLWELTTRRRLFTGDNTVAISGQICHSDAPRPSSIVADYPPALEEIVLKALARDREKRYASAQELQLELEKFAHDHRLLLSSARLASFMSELFAERISATKADIREQIAWRVDSGRDDSSLNSGFSGVNSTRELQEYDSDAGFPAQVSRRNLWLGLGALVLLLLLLAIVLALVLLQERRAPEPEPLPAGALTAAPATAPATAATTATTTAAAVSDPPVVPSTTSPVVSDPPVAPSATPPVVSDAAPPSGRRSSRKRSKKTSSGKKPSSKGSEKTKKPAWDPDSPLPPP